MKHSFKVYIFTLLTIPFIWVAHAVADHHKSGKTHNENDGHSHSKKKTKKHDHKKGHSDEDGHGHHDDNDGNHSKKKKNKVKHQKQKKNHDDDDDGHDHGHDESENKDESHGDHDDDEEGHDDHGSHDEHGSDNFGKGKAITEVQDEGKSFSLAEEAQDLMGLKYSVVTKARNSKNFVVPNESLIYFNDEKGIFIKEGKWFELVEVRIVKKGSLKSVIAAKNLSHGQRIVVAGTGLLRVAHLQASGQGGKGHAH